MTAVQDLDYWQERQRCPQEKITSYHPTILPDIWNNNKYRRTAATIIPTTTKTLQQAKAESQFCFVHANLFFISTINLKNASKTG
jgi:hypothetical protein